MMSDDVDHGDDGAPADDAAVDPISDHRGGFGDFGGASDGFIERTFRERIVLVGVQFPGRTRAQVDAALDELELLVDTAGADSVARVVQRRDRPDPATFLGRGKVAELAELAIVTDCDTVVFDEELSAAQQRNLEKLLGRTAIDRTAVILDIFAQNAMTAEGRAQVELALLRYRLPRLRGRGTALSRQGGGLGTRMGGGETKLEIDRRRIIGRIHRLEAELAAIDANRATQRKARERGSLPMVTIVGYTNAGKSTLLNRLAGTQLLTEDRLFATLDAATRRTSLTGGREVLLTDTVGFIRKLPHQLVEAFKSTLEVVNRADLLLHVVDASDVDPGAQYAAVRAVLAEIGAEHIPEVIVANKWDRVAPSSGLRALVDLPDAGRDAVAVSAVTGEGIDDLGARIGHELDREATVVEWFIPYAKTAVLAALHREGAVIDTESDADGVHVTARLATRAVPRFAAMLVGA
ncbi:MAG: GTPase HflX [Actinobacteria bacterium]|nr:GTPase HflX [Actinomycetota bacterium]